MAKPCTPHLIAQRVQLFEPQAANVRGQGAWPLAFSWGSKGVILSRERMVPLFRSARGAALPCRLQGVYSILHNSTIMVTNRISVLPQIFQFQNYVNFDTRLSAQYVFHSAEIKSIFPCQIMGF